MFDREQFRKEITAQLKDVPRDKQVAFAVRSAMRVLPLLARLQQKKEIFGFWKTKDKSKYLLAVFTAYTSVIEFVLTKKRPDTSIAYKAYATASDSTDAADFRGDTDVANYAFATYAIYAAADACDADASDIIAAIDTDFYSISKALKQDLAILKETTAAELLCFPLWSKNIVPKYWKKRLSNLKKDIVSLNLSFEIWLDWYNDRLYGKPISVELLKQWNNIPKEIEAQGVAAINAYLQNLVQGNLTHPLNRVRAIFIGYGEAGKTSLIRALHGEEVTKGKEAMTCGIEIRDWQVPNTDIQAHFWDFGGQVVFHSTHKFFLRSSCVYIIVINARADINNSEQAEYWLDHVKVFGGSAPVLLVGNKADEAQIHLQMQTLSQKYPNLKGYYPVSCTEAKNRYQSQFEIFKQALTHELQAVGIHQMLFTPAQGKVLDELRQNSLEDAFLSETDFNHICGKYGISNEGELNRDWLVDIFDKLGVMLHFKELKTFHNAYMLNPRWLTHGVYTLMNAKQARLNEGDIVSILKNSKVEDEYQHLLNYPADKCLFISKAMQRFKLCYPLRNGENAMLIPALLSDELPSANISSFKNLEGLNDTLQFEFAFSGFLPRNLIGEFMVSRYEEIKNNLQSQRGAVFKSRSLQAEALVEADYHRRLIIMQVVGRDAKEYLTILYDAMLTVFGELNLDKTEKIYLPLSACLGQEKLRFDNKVEKIAYLQFLSLARNKERTCYSESGLRYDVNKVLGFILSETEQAKQGITQIFNGNVGDINMSKQKIEIGAGAKIGSGSFNVDSKIENSFNSLQESKADNQTQDLLKELLNEIKVLNEKVPAAQAAKVQSIAEETETLIAESSREQPRKRWYEASLEGIKEAALAVGEIATPVLAIAEKLSPLLIG